MFNGFTGSSVPVAASADVSAAAQQAAAQQAAAQQQLASINSQIPHFYGGAGASGNAFAAASFNGKLPSSFTAISSTQAIYNAGTAATDQQTVSEICTSVLGTNGSRTLILRSNTAGTTYVYVKLWLDGNVAVYGTNFIVDIGCYVAGVNTLFSRNYYPIYYVGSDGQIHGNIGYNYALGMANGVQTFEATDYTFTYTQNTGLSVSYVDGSHVSQKGASYRSGGFADSSGVPGSILSWDFYDSGPTQGPATAFVATNEATTSTTYADLATTTDQITVNVGSSGLLMVFISSEINPGTTNQFGFVSFALSGANTQAADDSYAIAYQAYANTAAHTTGTTFLLTGLNAGATTVKMKYRISSAVSTINFLQRRISAIPL
jgi:hypothetical protein